MCTDGGPMTGYIVMVGAREGEGLRKGVSKILAWWWEGGEKRVQWYAMTF